MAQRQVTFDKPTTVTNPQGQQITLQPGQHFLGEGWNVMGSTPPTPTTPTTPATPTDVVGGGGNNFGNAFEQAANLIDSGISTPMSVADIRSREAQEREARRLQAEDIFNPKIARAEEIGGRQIGSAKGQFGVSRGLGLSTAEMTYVNNLENQVSDRIEEIRKSKESYISTGDFEAAQRADDAILKLQEGQDNILFQKINLGLKLMGEQRANVGLDIDILSTLSKIPVGQKVTIGGQVYEGLSVDAIEPFFKGGDIVSLMKSVPVGQEFQLKDPSTGNLYTIVGLSSEDPKLKQFTATDDQGNFTIINFDPTANNGQGAVVGGVTTPGVGKSKTQPSNVSVNFPRQERTPIYSANGKQIGYQAFNPIDLSTKNFDLSGNPIDFPEGGRLAPVGYNADEGDEPLFP